MTDSGELRTETVLALDNLPIELPVAGLGSRLVAAALDYFVVGVLLLGWLLAVGFTLAALPDLAGWVFAGAILGFFLIDYGYFAAFEAFRGGQTPGKQVMRLRVTSSSGARADRMAALIRNCVRTIDMVVGAPLMLLDPLARRLGDRIAGTLVLHELSAQTAVTIGRVPHGWGAAELSVAEAFFRRLPELEPARADVLAGKLLEVVGRADPSLLADVPDGSSQPERLRRALGVERAG